MCIDVLLNECLCTTCTHVQCLWRPEEGTFEPAPHTHTHTQSYLPIASQGGLGLHELSPNHGGRLSVDGPFLSRSCASIQCCFWVLGDSSCAISGRQFHSTSSHSTFFVVFCFVFPDRASLCVPGCPRALLVDQTVFEGKDLPASQIAGIKGV